MVDKYIIEVAWGKNIKTKTQNREALKQRLKKKLKSVGSAVKISALDMGKKVSRNAYKVGKEIKRDQEEKGGFYNLKGNRPKLKKLKKLKRRFVYVYPKRKVKKVYIRPKKFKRRNETYYNPFNLSI